MNTAAAATSCFGTHDWQLFAAGESDTEFVGTCIQLHDLFEQARTDARPVHWGGIRGEMTQLDLLRGAANRMDRDLVKKRAVVEAHVWAKMDALGIDRSNLRVHVMKFLASPPNEGAQQLHFDTTVYGKACKRFSAIVHLNDSVSTRLPRKSAEYMRPAFLSGEYATDAQGKSIEKLCVDSNFISVPVHTGDVCLFRATTVHAGPKNPSKKIYRSVIYVEMSEKTDNDKDQRFPQGVEVRSQRHNLKRECGCDSSVMIR